MRFIVIIMVMLLVGCAGIETGNNPDGSRYIKQTGIFPCKGKIGDSELDTKMSLIDLELNGVGGIDG